MKISVQMLIPLIMLLLSNVPQASEYSFKVEVAGSEALPKMILIPGLASSGDVWQSTVKHYQGKFQTHTLTLNGFAGVPATSDATLADIAKQIVTYANRNKLHKPTIVGHSLGGFLALSIGIDNPDFPGKLVIVDSLPFLPAAQNPMANVQSAKPFAEQMRQQFINANDPKVFASMQTQSLRGLVKDKEGLKAALKWSLDSDRKTVGNRVYQLMTTDLRQNIKHIKAPTLVLGSWAAYANFGATMKSTKGVFDRQYQQLKTKTIEMAPEAYHFIMLDSPQWMLAQTDNFLL